MSIRVKDLTQLTGDDSEYEAVKIINKTENRNSLNAAIQIEDEWKSFEHNKESRKSSLQHIKNRNATRPKQVLRRFHARTDKSNCLTPKVRYHSCPICPQNVGPYTDILDRVKSARLYNHLISQHQHLMFRCCYGRGNKESHNDNGKLNLKDRFCNKMYQCFLTLEELRRHLEYVHQEKDIKKDSVMPDDIRTAHCNICGINILCRGRYQIDKHLFLNHLIDYQDIKGSDVTLSCRLCGPSFKTDSYEIWIDHFYSDYKRCKGCLYGRD